MATIETRESAALTLTERAAGKVKALMAQEPAGEAEVLRVAIRGGGCGGFEYALGFDRGAAEGDSEAEFHGVRVVVDPASVQYLKGATVDFVGARSARRCTRPSRAEDRLAELREDRGEGRLSVLRQRRGRQRRRARRPPAPLRRRGLHGRRADRPPPRHSRRGARGIVGGD